MIELERLTVRSGTFTLIDINLTVPTGAFAVLTGRTGAGKTTLLEAICGLRTVRSGRIRLAGRDVTTLRPADRHIGYVPQDLALFPTMSVRDHLAFALSIRKVPKKRIAERVAELAELLGLTTLLDRKPRGLSGGESQRVALGRALSAHPPVLLLDEPFSALDDQTRTEMTTLLQTVRIRTPITVLHITHNKVEAEALGDLRFHLDEGQIVCRSSEIREN